MADDAVKPFIGEPGTNTIVIVEPDVRTRIVLADYLREYGYRVAACANADDVLIILAAPRKIDAVLSEAELDGLHLAPPIRETHPTADAPLTSGAANAAGNTADLCADGPLEKAQHPRDVVRRINRLRERRRRTCS
jgi:DNA-binding response OmpR family regulator